MVLAAALAARSIAHARLTVPSRVQDDQIRILACVGGFKETSTCVFRSRDLSLLFCNFTTHRDYAFDSRNRVSFFTNRDGHEFDATDPLVSSAFHTNCETQPRYWRANLHSGLMTRRIALQPAGIAEFSRNL